MPAIGWTFVIVEGIQTRSGSADIAAILQSVTRIEAGLTHQAFPAFTVSLLRFEVFQNKTLGRYNS